MRFVPYTVKDADKVLEMMSRHFDYTPELASAENKASNIEYFKEVYCSEGYSEICYILNADDKSVLGFLEATKQRYKKGKQCWYITSLFALDCKESDDYAHYMVNEFCSILHDADEICANVHPSVGKAVRFWLGIGFRPNPERAVYINSEGQRLVACWKKL